MNYTSKIFRLTKLQVLNLSQSSYHFNLTSFGKELSNLKKLCIVQDESKDIGMFYPYHLLPEEITLLSFKVSIFDLKGVMY